MSTSAGKKTIERPHKTIDMQWQFFNAIIGQGKNERKSNAEIVSTFEA